jgi:DNA (cytosine-5)-methyltransferase 1
VVNAAEHGFPQRRIRVFILGYRTDLGVTPDVLAKTFGIQESLGQTEFGLDSDPEKISDEFNVGGRQSPFLNYGTFNGQTVATSKVSSPKPKKPETLGDVLLDSGDVPEEYFVPESKLGEWRYLKGSKKIERVSKSGFKYHYAEGSMAFPDLPENPSRTILTGEGGSTPSRFKHIILQDGRYRRLTPIELERLNGFPDNWTARASGDVSIGDGRRAFFMGNALVVGLIEMVGRELGLRLRGAQ